MLEKVHSGVSYHTSTLTLDSNMEDGIEASGNRHLVSSVATFENVEENHGSKKNCNR